MPSKYRKKLLKKRLDYTANSSVSKKEKAKTYYAKNAEIIKQRTKARAKTDETWRKNVCITEEKQTAK